MGFLFGSPEKRSDPQWFGVGDPSPSSVSEARATSLTPVFATFRHLVDYVSLLPADFYRKEDGAQVKVGVPSLIRNVDEEFGLSNWFGQAVYSIAAQGNAVGRITSMSGFDLPNMVQWSGEWSYSQGWFVDGRSLPQTLVAHIPWLVPPGKKLGLSPLEHYAATVRAGLSAQEYADVKRGGGVPPTHLKNTQRVLDAEQSSIFQSRAVASFASGKPFVSGSDWDLTMLTIPPNHAQFIETLKLSANQIAAIYGIDPREIGGDVASSLTYTTDESRALNRAQNATPYVVRLENAVNRMLPQATYMKLNMNARIRADIKTSTDVIGAKLADGRLSLNEALALDDRPPVTGGDYRNVPTPIGTTATREGATQ